jgi:menaquinone-dependent protoporphyrinogen IX oxidase
MNLATNRKHRHALAQKELAMIKVRETAAKERSKRKQEIEDRYRKGLASTHGKPVAAKYMHSHARREHEALSRFLGA